MHPNFYHWHARAELKPEPAILEPRWEAAAQFVETLSVADICSLLRLVVFQGAEPEFATRFTNALVRAEPTFPIDRNAELLRVMAAVTVYSGLEEPSEVANAMALGLRAASFPQRRIEPVCDDVMARGVSYLAEESERARPAIDTKTLEKAGKATDEDFAALNEAVKKTAGATTPEGIGEATEAFRLGLLAAVRRGHQQLGDVIARLSEESQFLWWLVGRRSPTLNARRDQLTAAAYALPAAAEAAERVALLPPAASVESLLEEALAQCGSGGRASMRLTELIAAADAGWVQHATSALTVPELTPVAALLAARQQARKCDPASLKKLGLTVGMKVTPEKAAQQYFRERMFLRAVESVGQ